jgi:ABC-type nitrate/sulfonate/bicarbonate transport system substrate-binding protein
MSHPDSVAAILKPGHEVTAHVATSPSHEAEMKAGLRTVTSAYDILGGQATTSNLVTSAKFRTENPKSYAAVIPALDEAFAWINADKRRAAKLYIQMTNRQAPRRQALYPDDQRTAHDRGRGLCRAHGTWRRMGQDPAQGGQAGFLHALCRHAEEQAGVVEGSVFP